MTDAIVIVAVLVAALTVWILWSRLRDEDDTVPRKATWFDDEDPPA